jgi:Tol biopolymer transport system component
MRGDSPIWWAPPRRYKKVATGSHRKPMQPFVVAALVATAADERQPSFSPDGTLLAYSSDETGTREVHVRPHPGPGGRIRVSPRGGAEPLWSRAW